MTRTLNFTRQAALAASTIARLAARANLTRFVDKSAQRIHIFVIEAFAFGAVFGVFLTAAVATSTPIIATPVSIGATSTKTIRTSPPTTFEIVPAIEVI
jgi:hypothetical protein